MFSLLTILIIAWLVSLSGFLITIAYWPLTLFLTWAYALKNVGADDFRLAHPREVATLLIFGILFTFCTTLEH